MPGNPQLSKRWVSSPTTHQASRKANETARLGKRYQFPSGVNKGLIPSSVPFQHVVAKPSGIRRSRTTESLPSHQDDISTPSSAAPAGRETSIPCIWLPRLLAEARSRDLPIACLRFSGIAEALTQFCSRSLTPYRRG